MLNHQINFKPPNKMKKVLISQIVSTADQMRIINLRICEGWHLSHQYAFVLESDYAHYSNGESVVCLTFIKYL